MEELRLIVPCLCIGFIFIASGASLLKAHQGKPSYGVLTFFLCLPVLGVLGLNYNKNVKINGRQLSIEITEQQAKALTELEQSLNKNDIEGAKASYANFKTQVIDQAKFPGVAVGLLRNMTIEQYLELKKSEVRESIKAESLMKKE